MGAGHGDLAGAVVVDGIDLVKLGAEPLHSLVGQLQDRRHGGGLFLGSGLHQLPPAADQVEAGGQVHRAGIGQGPYLPQGEAGGHVGLQPPLRQSGGGSQLHGE